MNLGLFFVLLLMCVAITSHNTLRKELLLCAQDDDTKIAPEIPSHAFNTADNSESVAQEYQRHKLNGNIFMANRLGEALATPLLNADRTLFSEANEENIGQIYFLFGFAVRRAVQRCLPVTILADTVLHSFSETTENYSSDLFSVLYDSVADTVYRLSLSQADEIGICFAKLCGHDGETPWIQLGNTLFNRFEAFACDKIQRFSFKP